VDPNQSQPGGPKEGPEGDEEVSMGVKKVVVKVPRARHANLWRARVPRRLGGAVQQLRWSLASSAGGRMPWRGLVVWLALGAAPAAYAGDRAVLLDEGERYRPTSDVMAALGVHESIDRPEDLEWGVALDARLATDLECGALKFDVDVNAAMERVADLPAELAVMGTSLVGALPMLAICHLSPSVCAEIKNLNLRIDQDLDFRAAMCQSIDKFVDEQADEGERIRRDAQKLAEQQCIQDAGGDAEAVRDCTENAQSGLVTDIAQGFLGEEVSRGPQLLVESALNATNSEIARAPGFHRLLTSVAGESTIGVNGEVYPLLERGTLTSDDIVDALLYWGEHYSCSLSRLDLVADNADPDEAVDDVSSAVGDPTPSTEYAVDTLVEVMADRVTATDVDNLRTLKWANYRAFCMSLRQTAARETALVMRDRVVAVTDKAEENPELPSLGKSKLRQAKRTAEAVLASFDDDSQTLDFAAWSTALAQAAASERGHQAALAETLRQGEKAQETLWGDAPCASYTECKEDW
jgi:hypothetical protein